MEDRNNQMIYLKNELERLRRENEFLTSNKVKLECSAEFNRSCNEQSAKLLAIEYIVKSSEYSIDRKALCSVLGITFPKEG